MQVQLRRLGPNSKIKILRIPKDCRTKIWLAGRGTTCQIYTKSKYASRQHFSITYREQKYFISDLQSANGTFLNDEKLVEEKMLAFGSLISVGVPSEMWPSPDCIVYVFEPFSELLSTDEQPSLPENEEVIKTKIVSGLEPTSNPESVIDMEVDTSKCKDKELAEKSLDMNKSNIEASRTDQSDSSSSDIVFIESFNEPKEPSDSVVNQSKPAKIRKLEGNETITITKQEKIKEIRAEFPSEKDQTKAKQVNTESEDIFAYEALTQVDEEFKTEPDLLNYSLTEEVIEISDSEEEWSAKLEPEERRISEDEDDDIIVLETILRSKSKEPIKNDVPLLHFAVGDELTETDKKWLGKLLKVKEESDIIIENDEVREQMEVDQQVEEAKETLMEVEESEESEPVKAGEKLAIKSGDINTAPPTVNLSRLSAKYVETEIPVLAAESIPRVKIPQKIIKKVMPKKSVSFNMVPQIKYFEVPSRPRLTTSEKGKLRFTRIIYNICNWNTHWLEECKRVAPDKHPPICEEVLKKIPKKFATHSDYMSTFIPLMLLHLWNKVKEKWVNSGNSAFRQTVSCDTSEDYHAENLSVFKCTGLVQSVEAHKLLIREGHLVLLRLHQIQNPQFATPASEKYSKKLGYLVFGFVESKIYQRFHNQPLHPSLAERCASVVGDLHIVRLTILAKKRPSFQIDKGKLIQLTVVHHISQEIRMLRGICFLPDSPLCVVILKPSKNECLLVEPPVKENLIFTDPLDDVQSEIVRRLSYGCFSKDSLLYSIYGAAGTGKGQVVIALILQLLYGSEWKDKRPKIIYCTQWSIPLDEMVVRLKNYRQTFDKPFHLVRVGPIKEVKPEVRDLCVSNLASTLRNSDKRVVFGRTFDAEIEVIKEADVICTTCLSTGISKMCSAFEKLALNDKDQKVICIIDEAMSCKETDSVIPLLLGVTHLILVGDIYQMEPTFSGEKTHSLGLDMSLFWRIYKNFSSIPKDLWPIYILKTQYRMNSSLSKFTSQLIYSTLLPKPALNVSNKIGNMKSHLLLLDQTPENVMNEEKENREVRIVSHLVQAVTKLAKAAVKNVILRFAVIMCDKKQVESLQSLLPKREFPDVEIGQIQAFQGREFDVVTFAYDGRKILTSWLATALTRARSSLFIFMSESSVNRNGFFQRIAEDAEKRSFLKYVHSEMTIREYEQLLMTA